MTLKTEPVLIANIVGVLVFLASMYGLNLSTEQLTTIASAIVIVATWFSRSRVTPTA